MSILALVCRRLCTVSYTHLDVYKRQQEDKFIVPHRKPAVGKSTVVSVRLPDTMLAKLEDVAAQTGRTRNELVQMCIDYALARLEISEE